MLTKYFSITTILFLFYTNFALAQIEVVPGEFVVQLKNSESLKHFTKKLSKEIKISPLIKNLNIFKLTTHYKNLESLKVEFLKSSKFLLTNIKIIEPNYIYKMDLLPNDEKFSEQWGLKNSNISKKISSPLLSQFDIHGEMSWDLTTGNKKVIVAVIDTGIDYQHPDLKDNMWVNSLEKEGLPGVDDDGNGYIDDIHGYDFVDNDNEPLDELGHGTHCAGIIGATGNNNIGISGVNWQVRLMAVKFMSPGGGGSLALSLRAIEYAANNGARVINASWGGGARSEILANLIQSLDSRGILFVAAAGNSSRNIDLRPHFPASYPASNIISVAALDKNGLPATFSNYGKRGVDIAGPGVKILSTLPDGKYGKMSGTSMAAPFVTGVVALALSREPNLTAKELKERIVKKGYRLKSLKDIVHSSSLVSAYGTLTNIRPDPEPNPEDPFQWESMTYSLMSAHPYLDNNTITYEINVPGVEKMAIHFKKFQTEEGFDLLYIYNKENKIVAAISGDQSDTFSPTVFGDYAKIVFITDQKDHQFGFEVDKIHFKLKQIEGGN